jgi:hypothetical protein
MSRRGFLFLSATSLFAADRKETPRNCVARNWNAFDLQAKNWADKFNATMRVGTLSADAAIAYDPMGKLYRSFEHAMRSYVHGLR